MPLRIRVTVLEKPDGGSKNQHQGTRKELQYIQPTELDCANHPAKERNPWSTNRDGKKQRFSANIYRAGWLTQPVKAVVPVSVGLPTAVGAI